MAATEPVRLLLLALAGWISRHQQDVIDYLVEENRVLKEQMGGKRLRLTDDQRRRLAAKGRRIGRQALDRVATIVTPDTIMRWHRRLIAQKWTYGTRRVGRPGLMKAIKALIVRMARENSSWGYCRIQGELEGLGHRVSSTTIATVLKENGIKPAPDRPSSWRSFLKAHWGEVAQTPKNPVRAPRAASQRHLTHRSAGRLARRAPTSAASRACRTSRCYSPSWSWPARTARSSPWRTPPSVTNSPSSSDR